MAHLVVDHRGATVRSTSVPTWLAYGSTLLNSSRILARAGIGRLGPDALERRKHRWSEQILAVSGTSVGVDGEEHVDPNQAYVLISNHQSLLDPIVALAAFPGRLTFVAKQELARVPVFAGAMSAAQVVFVDRKDAARAKAQLEHAKQVVADRVSIWFAAEGTRSPDGELGRLKKGAFHVAMALGTPILPTWIEGARDVLPPHSMQTRTGQTVWVAFGSPIATAGVDRRGIPALVDRTRGALLTLQQRAAALR